MIEVEKKFAITPHQQRAIEECSVFVGSSCFVDKYYDSSDFFLTSRNMWLRKRDEQFELKIAAPGFQNNIDTYEEILGEEAISQSLLTIMNGALSELISSGTLFPFGTVETKRMKYQLGEFTIDIDHATAEDFVYHVAEIEIMVGDNEAVKAAEEKILALAQTLSLDTRVNVVGKFPAYLKKNKPEHYEHLVQCGVIRKGDVYETIC